MPHFPSTCALLLLASLRTLAATADGIAANPSALTFTYQIGAALPTSQNVQIKRTIAGAALDFTVTVPATVPWLIVTPTAGKTGTAVSFRVNPASLLARTYTAPVQIAAAGIADPIVVNVTLTVKNAPPVPAVSPASLTFNFQTDQAAPPDPQALAISSSGEPISFTAAVSGAPWLSIDPALGIAVTGGAASLAVAANCTGLTPGTYQGKITVSFTNSPVRSTTVNVTLNVTAGGPVITSLWPSSAPIGSLDTTVTVRGRNLFSSTTVQAGTTALNTTWISNTAMLATIPKSLLAAQGTLAFTATNTGRPASAAANFTVNPPGPHLDAVVNAASFTTGNPTPTIAPGELITIFGSGLGPGATETAQPSGGAFPTSLGTPATTVEFQLADGSWAAAPIIFVEANQINAVSPFALTPAAGQKLRVTYNGITSDLYDYDAVDADPGIFTIDSSGQGQGAILNYNEPTDTYTLNSASNPAPVGSKVSVYVTGAGVTNPLPAAEGMIVPLAGDAPPLQGDVSVSIGADGAVVNSAALVKGSVAGLAEIVVTVPDTLKPGKELPVVITIAGRSSPATATIAVK